jgi:hypothetical protein
MKTGNFFKDQEMAYLAEYMYTTIADGRQAVYLYKESVGRTDKRGTLNRCVNGTPWMSTEIEPTSASAEPRWWSLCSRCDIRSRSINVSRGLTCDVVLARLFSDECNVTATW